MKFRQHIFSALVRAVITLVIVSFLIALLVHFWNPSYSYILE
jgi:hypothetical protein